MHSWGTLDSASNSLNLLVEQFWLLPSIDVQERWAIDPPELSDSKYSVLSDVYSFGVVCYTLIDLSDYTKMSHSAKNEISWCMIGV